MLANLRVLLLRYTPEPEKMIASAAKLCYSASGIADLVGKQTDEKAKEFVDKLVSMGHESPIEHVVYTFGIEGISRACTHQLVRHRIASYSQQSQRYVSEQSQKHGGVFDYIIPPSFKQAGREEWFKEKMQEIQKYYDKAEEILKKAGYIGEAAHQDARFLLPNAAETKIIVTMNARELFHFFRKRACNRAQWEIRDMAKGMYKLVLPTAPSLFKYAGPDCVTDACHEGKMSCGLAEKVRKEFGNITVGVK